MCFPIVSYLFICCKRERKILENVAFPFFSHSSKKSWILNQTLSKASIMDRNEKRNRVHVIGKIENRREKQREECVCVYVCVCVCERERERE